MTRKAQNTELHTGDDRDLTVTIYTTTTGTGLKNLTGATATYSVRDAPGGTILFAAKTSSPANGIVISGTPADGTLIISILSADTASVVVPNAVTDYYHELEISIGGKIATAFEGRFRLKKSVSGAGA